MRRLLALVCLLASCGTVDFDNLPAGEFTGTLHVIWVGEGRPNVGDGLFVYVPDPHDPLRFVRRNPDATITEIVPEMIYTDGGSIPRPVTLFRGFSPWGYAPAYIVHDWLFVARHCLNDGDTGAPYADYAAMEFHESAEIIAEAIKALVAQGRVAPNQVAPRAISGAVAGPISFERWQAVGECDGHRVPPDIAERARLGTPGAAVPRSGFSILRMPDGGVERVTPGQTVATFSF